MARLPYAEPANPDVPKANIFRLLANAETVFAPWARYGLALLRDTTVDPLLRELAILRVAALTPGAEYEWVQHEAIARAVGASDEQVEACRSGVDAEGNDALVLRFTEEVVRDATPSDETFATMTKVFSAQEIIELLLVIGQYMTLGRIMATAQIDMDEPIGASFIGE
jgi:4-carboxymuconolactone decarboxylase